MDTELRRQVARRAQSAQERLAAGDVAGAQEDVDAAFDLVEPHGESRDVCHVALLVVAADVALACDSLDAAAALYKRAFAIGDDLASDSGLPGDSSDVTALMARAMLGLARANVRGGHHDRAQARYRSALDLLEQLEGCPAALVDEARDGAEGRFD